MGGESSENGAVGWADTPEGPIAPLEWSRTEFPDHHTVLYGCSFSGFPVTIFLIFHADPLLLLIYSFLTGLMPLVCYSLSLSRSLGRELFKVILHIFDFTH